MIDHLQIDFEDGFSVITGETGSGKSILLGALGLILGERADFTSIRNSEQKCIVEGVFNISSKDHEYYFNKHDLDFAEETIIRREISPAGKSRAFINDTPVSLGTLKELGSILVDIHSQHETLLINDNQFILDLLDSQHNASKELVEYRNLFSKYITQVKELTNLREKDADAQNQKDFISFLIQEFEEHDLSSLAENNIEEEYQLLSNAEGIKRNLTNASGILNSGEQNDIISSLKQVRSELQDISALSPQFEEIVNRIDSTIIELQDIENECSNLADSTELDEQKLSQLEGQISFLNRLLHKHQMSNINELLIKYNQLKEEISTIDNLSEQIIKLEKEIKNSESELSRLADLVSKARKEIAKTLQTKAKSYLEQMNMKHAKVEFRFEQQKSFNSNGMDLVQIFVQTNLGGNFEPLKKVASGGETSRIMLAIKALQSESRSLPTIIFDEIDTGVSGEVASKMGGIMAELGSKMQVLSITHLPQIAAQGEHHYKVQKQEENNSTTTSIFLLDKKDRESEIAQLLSGTDISGAALKNARALLGSK